MKSRAAECLERAEALLDQGDPARAMEAFEQAVSLEPGFYAIHGRGSALRLLGRHADALADFDLALKLRPGDVAAIANRASALQDLGRHTEALEGFDRALSLRPGMPVLLLNRANLLQEIGRLDDALAAYSLVLSRTPGDIHALNNRGNVLHKLGRYDQALADFGTVLTLSPGFSEALYNRGRTLCESGNIQEGFASFLQAAESFQQTGDRMSFPPHKLQHDAEQAEWTRRAGIHALPGHIEGGARLAGSAINPANAAEVARAWSQSSPQLVVIDDLLTGEALAGLRRFCLGSDIWRKNYARGYLGAFPESGFACPLLAQIAEEFRTVFPAIFGDHPLVYLWAFKYDSRLRGIEVHADQAAVNVNFWITPDEANLEPRRGGLVVWDQAAPLDWDFEKFNADIPGARDFLARSGAQAITIPHRANRAVIFDSDLFHETDAITFREGYENRRINCTLLFGFRHTGRR
jgi:tetratricopeptide (TPR) repeat protein